MNSAFSRNSRTPCSLALAVAGAAFLAAGCAQLPTHGMFETISHREKPNCGVSQVIMIWDNRIRLANDTEHGGTPYPVLAGRMFLFNEATKQPLTVTGDVICDIYNATNPNPTGDDAKPYRVTLTKDKLPLLLRKDMVGEGFTIVLPWFSYRPDITKVKLQLQFKPENGSPVYADPALLTLKTEAPPPPPQVTHRRVPASQVPPWPRQ